MYDALFRAVDSRLSRFTAMTGLAFVIMVIGLLILGGPVLLKKFLRGWNRTHMISLACMIFVLPSPAIG